MRTKTFLTMAAMTVGLAMTGAMMTSCSKIDNPTDNPGEGLPGGQTVDLSMLMSDYVAQDGDTLRGTLDDNTQPYKISIAEGAKVVLRDAIIHRDQKNHMWAGITCEGEATIILVGENSVGGFQSYYPGIQPGPEGTTLTIKGEGKLTVRSGWAAGIGSGDDMTCGNICIEGGDIIATGGSNSAGIGCGYSASVCGDITIMGGTVIATGEGGAGIGSGDGANGTNVCGNITITGGTVTATGGGDSAGIGGGVFGTCGDITISGGTVIATGKELGTGIGCGKGDRRRPSVCGDITIENRNGFVSVTAIRGHSVAYPIGNSSINHEYNTCGNITFNGQSINKNGRIWDYTPKEDDYLYYDSINQIEYHLILTISSSDPDDSEKKNDTWTLTSEAAPDAPHAPE